jgi:hypothetical protein
MSSQFINAQFITAKTVASMKLGLSAALMASALSGCTVLSVAGAAAGAAVSVTGAVVSTGASVAGKVIEKTVEVVTPGKK